MSIRFALSFFAAIFTAAAPVGTAHGDNQSNVIRQYASRAGQVIGASAGCRTIQQSRVNGAMAKMSEVIRTSTANKPEMDAALEIFNKGIAEGQRGAGRNCEAADRELASLERTTTLLLQFPVQPNEGQPAAQQVAPQPQAQSATASIAPAPAMRGVSEREVKFGISAPMSGPSKELGLKMKMGIDAAFKRINEAGGVNGRQLTLIPADDGYEPTRTSETMKQLFEKDEVFGIVGNVGTPTAAVAVPFSLERRMLFFGAFTGAGLLRRDPPDRYVFNYRASYAEETDSVVQYLVKVRRLKPEQIVVFAQQDSFGDAGYTGVAKAMRALKGGEAVTTLRLNYKRNTVDVNDAIAQLAKQNAVTPVRAVVMVATYRAAAKFIERTRAVYPNMIYTNVSFVGSTALAEELMLLGPKFADGVIVTQVVPAVEGYSSLILEYKEALAKYFPGETPDYVSLEGYVTANVLAEGLRRAGRQLDTEKLIDALESIKDYDMGLGAILSYGRTKHQASNKVWGTQLDEAGRYQPIELE